MLKTRLVSPFDIAKSPLNGHLALFDQAGQQLNKTFDSNLSIRGTQLAPFFYFTPHNSNMNFAYGPLFSLGKEVADGLNKSLSYISSLHKEIPSDLSSGPFYPYISSWEDYFADNATYKNTTTLSPVMGTIKWYHILSKIVTVPRNPTTYFLHMADRYTVVSFLLCLILVVAIDALYKIFEVLNSKRRTRRILSCEEYMLRVSWMSLNPHYRQRLMNKPQKKVQTKSSFEIFLDHLGYYSRVLINSAPIQYKPSIYNLGVAWLLSTLVLTNYISGDIYTIIAQSTDYNIINSWEDLCKSSHIIPVTFTRNSDDYFPPVSKCAKELNKRLERIRFDKNYLSNLNYWFEKSANGSAGFVILREMLIPTAAQLNHKCELGVNCVHVSEEGGIRVPYFVGINTALPAFIKQRINVRIIQLRESGIFNLWMKKSLTNYFHTEQTFRFSTTIKEEYNQFTLAEFKHILILFCYANFLVLIFTLLEYVIFKLNNIAKKKKRRALKHTQNYFFNLK